MTILQQIFQIMSIEIKESLSLFDQAHSIHQQIPEFQNQSSTYDELLVRINKAKHPLVLVAYADNQPVGYLMGYERYQGSFYIWLAGVLPSHRRHRILDRLVKQTEQWANKANLRSLNVKTRNRFKSMLLFLISHDFKLIDIDKKQSVDDHRLIFEKQLSLL